MQIKWLVFLLAIGLSIFSYTFIDPNLSYLHFVYTDIAFAHRIFVSLVYLALLILFYILYFKIYTLLRNKNTLLTVFSIIIPLCIILFFSYPAMLSYDIFNYIATAKTLFFYQENPYIIMPIAFSGDPFLQFMHAANKTALYGFVWILLSGVPFILGLGNFLLTLFSFKLFIIFVYLLTIKVFSTIAKNVSLVALFALNPLVVIETLVSGHNDIVMVFFVLSSFYFFARKKVILALILFTFSIFIKYATLLLLPVVLWIFICHFLKKTIDWEKLYFLSFISMIGIFFLSPLREEIYPWYAVWFFPFALLTRKRNIILLSISLTFGLSLRYIPFMLTGNHTGSTPILKIILMTAPVICMLLYLLYKKRLWSNETLH